MEAAMVKYKVQYNVIAQAWQHIRQPLLQILSNLQRHFEKASKPI